MLHKNGADFPPRLTLINFSCIWGALFRTRCFPRCQLRQCTENPQRCIFARLRFPNPHSREFPPTFVKSELKDYITSQIFKIGNVGISFDAYNPVNLPCGRGFEEQSYIVSSLRLDNVVAAITGLSREKTKTLILSGCVGVNFVPEQNVSRIIKIDTTLTIRGRGKFILNDISGKTKKGRIKISVLHYR